MEKNYRILEFIRQGANWQSNLVHELVKTKKVYGAVGTKKILVEELMKYRTSSLPKGYYLMRLVSVVEKLQKKGIPRKLYEQLPLPYWLVLQKYVTKENVEDMINYLQGEGELKKLKVKIERGYILSYNIFTGEYEFIKRENE